MVLYFMQGRCALKGGGEGGEGWELYNQQIIKIYSDGGWDNFN